MIIDLTEVKAYLDANFTFEDEKVLEETAKGLKRVLENTVYGGIVYNGNVYSPYQKKKVEQLETDIEEVIENSSKGKVKDYSLTLSDRVEDKGE